MPSPRPDCVTGAEFARFIQEDHNSRQRAEARMDERHRSYMAELREIKAMVKDTNGRIGKAEGEVSIIKRDIEAIRSEDRSIEQTVQSIYKDGCHQFQNHVSTLAELEGAGIIPNQNGTPPRAVFQLPLLNRRQKTVAGVGIAALIIPALGDLVQVLQHLVTWLDTVRP